MYKCLCVRTSKRTNSHCKKNVYTKFGPRCKMVNYDTIVDFMGRKIGPMGIHLLAEFTVCNSDFSVRCSVTVATA